MAEIGLFLNPAKCYFWSADASITLSEDFAEFPLRKSNEGVTVLGTPVGNEAYVHARLVEKVSSLRQTLGKMLSLGRSGSIIDFEDLLRALQGNSHASDFNPNRRG